MRKAIMAMLILLPTSLFAQLTFELTGTTFKKISGNIPEGTSVRLRSLNAYEYGYLNATLECDGSIEEVNSKALDKIKFEPHNSKQFWQNKALQAGVYENIAKKGIQYKLRREIEEEALEYLRYIDENNLCFEDDYLA